MKNESGKIPLDKGVTNPLLYVFRLQAPSSAQRRAASRKHGASHMAAIQISRAHLHRLARAHSRAQSHISKVSRKAEHAFDVGINAGLAVGTGAALGFLHGRHGVVEVAGVPLELGLGVIGTGAALFGIGGRHADKLGTVAGTMLTIYGYNASKGAGLKMKASAEQKVLSKGKETVTGLPSQTLSDEELQTLNRPTVAERSAA